MVWRSIKNSALVSDEKLETIADHDYDDFQVQSNKNYLYHKAKELLLDDNPGSIHIGRTKCVAPHELREHAQCQERSAARGTIRCIT